MKTALTWILCLLFGVVSARAQLTVSFVPQAQNAAAGGVVIFSGTLANTSATDRVFLNDIQPALTGSAAAFLVFQPNTFFANVPGILLPGETYSGPLFSVSRSGSSPPADYGGSVAILGGTNVFASGSLVSANFTVLWPEETLAATAITGTGATLNATVDPSGVDTVVSFQYGVDASYGQTTSSVDIGSGTSSVPVSESIAGLLANTGYHYRVVAAATSGTAYGTDQTFTTPAIVPAATPWTALAAAMALFAAGALALRVRRPLERGD